MQSVCNIVCPLEDSCRLFKRLLAPIVILGPFPFHRVAFASLLATCKSCSGVPTPILIVMFVEFSRESVDQDVAPGRS